MTTLQAFEQWLQTEDKAARTVQAYTQAVAQFASWFRHTNGKPLKPTAITPLDVKAWRERLVAVRELAPSTVNQYLAAVRAYARWAQAAGKIARNPTKGIKMVKTVAAPPRWLTRSEQFALLRAAQEATQLGHLKAQGSLEQPSAIWSRRDEAILVFLLNTGLRLSEIEALNLTDMEINARSGSVRVRRGKGRKARTVPLNHDARTALQAWLDVRPEDASEALFLSQKGGRLSSRAISNVIAKFADRAGLEDVSPHTLRHSFAKNLVDADVGLEKVATLLGHESLETTRLYTQPSKADLQAATDKVAWQE
jgi:integrase/recombinase XerC